MESGYGGENYALKSSFWIGGIVKTSLYLGIVNKDLYGGPFGYASYFFDQWDRTGVSEEKAKLTLEKYGTVKKALFSILSGIEDKDKIEEILNKNKGHIRRSLEEVNK